MKKAQTFTGPNGASTAEVIVSLNHTVESYTYHNHSTHDDERKARMVHLVVGKLDGNIEEERKVNDEKEAADIAIKMFNNLSDRAENRANATPIETAYDILKKQGFN